MMWNRFHGFCGGENDRSHAVTSSNIFSAAFREERFQFTDMVGKLDGVKIISILQNDEFGAIGLGDGRPHLREGEFGKSWIPALAVGVNDPTTGDVNKRSDIDLLDFDVSSGNGFFNRVYVVATKHFPTPLGTLGAHVGYQYNRRDDRRYNGPCAALDWEPVWLRKEQWLTTKLIAEYDARTFNVGMIASVWDGHFELMVDLQALRWLSAGIRFKMILQ